MNICECKIIEQYSKDPDIPIRYDSKFNEYSLEFGSDNGGNIYFEYCFSCGGRLPESKRGDFFTTPDKDLVNQYKKMLRGVNSAEEIIQILGTPDFQYNNPTIREIDKDLYGIKEQKRQFDYKQLSETFILSVSEYADGTFDYCFFGNSKE